MFFQTTSSNTDLLPFFYSLEFIVCDFYPAVLRSHKKLPQKLRLEDHGAFDYKNHAFHQEVVEREKFIFVS
jgi:hypothetical protein